MSLGGSGQNRLGHKMPDPIASNVRLDWAYSSAILLKIILLQSPRPNLCPKYNINLRAILLRDELQAKQSDLEG